MLRVFAGLCRQIKTLVTNREFQSFYAAFVLRDQKLKLDLFADFTCGEGARHHSLIII